MNIYVVAHVQAHENFKSKNFIKWFLSKGDPYYFTNSFKKAIYLANSMNKKNCTEHGIKIADTKLALSDVKASIREGKVVFDFPHPDPFSETDVEAEDETINLQEFVYREKGNLGQKSFPQKSERTETYSSIVSSLTNNGNAKPNNVEANTHMINLLSQLNENMERLTLAIRKK